MFSRNDKRLGPTVGPSSANKYYKNISCSVQRDYRLQIIVQQTIGIMFKGKEWSDVYTKTIPEREQASFKFIVQLGTLHWHHPPPELIQIGSSWEQPLPCKSTFLILITAKHVWQPHRCWRQSCPRRVRFRPSWKKVWTYPTTPELMCPNVSSVYRNHPTLVPNPLRRSKRKDHLNHLFRAMGLCHLAIFLPVRPTYWWTISHRHSFVWRFCRSSTTTMALTWLIWNSFPCRIGIAKSIPGMLFPQSNAAPCVMYCCKNFAWHVAWLIGLIKWLE